MRVECFNVKANILNSIIINYSSIDLLCLSLLLCSLSFLVSLSHNLSFLFSLTLIMFSFAPFLSSLEPVSLSQPLNLSHWVSPYLLVLFLSVILKIQVES